MVKSGNGRHKGKRRARAQRPLLQLNRPFLHQGVINFEAPDYGYVSLARNSVGAGGRAYDSGFRVRLRRLSRVLLQSLPLAHQVADLPHERLVLVDELL